MSTQTENPVQARTSPFIVDPAWLAQMDETALEPALPIVDPHHHLWDHPGHRYLLDELRDDLGGGHNIVATVFVECMAFYRADGPPALRPVGETEVVNGVAAMSASGQYGDARLCAGIVGFADLTLGAAVDEVLAAHVQAGGGRFRGIRHAVAWDASDDVRNSHTKPTQGLLRDPAFRAGFARLAAHELSFDAWLYHPQLADVVDLARHFPETTIVLDHVGGPLGIGPYAGRRDEVFATWRGQIAELAACDNVVVKLGGLGMKICGFDFHHRDVPPSSQVLAEAWRPYLMTCIEAFGPGRCMFESNFPVDKASCNYTVLWNALKRVSEGFSAEERADLFQRTASRVYRL